MTDSFRDAGAFVVFGATGGIGSATVQRLLDAGATVVLASRHPEPTAHAAAHPVACDVTDPAAIRDCLRFAKEVGGGTVSGIALCVGSVLLKPAHLTTAEEWASVISANLTSAFLVAQAAGKAMRSGGSVVFCSSAAASTGLPNHDAISAAKAGIEGLVRSAAATYASRGLRFHAVAPGLVRTPMTEALTSDPQTLTASASMHALGRIGEPGEVAAAIAWLLDPENCWTSGGVFRVDGGLAQLRPAARR